jgi:tetratricopeptide (TPR) repeat protein
MRRFGFYVGLLAFLLSGGRAMAETSTFDSGGSVLQLRRLADADREAYHGRYTRAIAEIGKAIAEQPNFAAAYMERAYAYIEAGRFGEAASDLNRVAGMHPDAREVPIAQAISAIRQLQANAALASLAHAASLPTASMWDRQRRIAGVYSASLFYAYRSLADQLAGDDKAALADLASAMQNEVERPWYILGRLCNSAAIVGLLDLAELTCQEAIDRSPRDLGEFDSLGLVHLKQKAWDKAIADYTRALGVRADLTLSLYGRGLAKRAKGDLAGSTADMAAAQAGEPDIANIMASRGVTPP